MGTQTKMLNVCEAHDVEALPIRGSQAIWAKSVWFGPTSDRDGFEWVRIDTIQELYQWLGY